MIWLLSAPGEATNGNFWLNPMLFRSQWISEIAKKSLNLWLQIWYNFQGNAIISHLHSKHNFGENSSFFYVASDLLNNLEHANLTHFYIVAMSQLQVNASWWKLHGGCVIWTNLFSLKFMVIKIYFFEISQNKTVAGGGMHPPILPPGAIPANPIYLNIEWHIFYNQQSHLQYEQQSYGITEMTNSELQCQHEYNSRSNASIFDWPWQVWVNVIKTNLNLQWFCFVYLIFEDSLLYHSLVEVQTDTRIASVPHFLA